MRSNAEGNDNVTIDDEENAVFVGDIKIENLVPMPEDAGEFVTSQRRMPPVRREESKFSASGALDFSRKVSKLSLKSNGAPVDHRSSTALSIVS